MIYIFHHSWQTGVRNAEISSDSQSNYSIGKTGDGETTDDLDCVFIVLFRRSDAFAAGAFDP